MESARCAEFCLTVKTLGRNQIYTAIRCRCKCQVSATVSKICLGSWTRSTDATLSASCNSPRNVNINWLQDNKGAALAAAAALAALAACGVHVANNQLCKQKSLSHTHTHLVTHTQTRGQFASSLAWLSIWLSLRWQFLIAHSI